MDEFKTVEGEIKTAETIKMLIEHLPDSIHKGNESWSWGWWELDEEAQQAVKKARKAGMDFLENMRD